MTEIGAPTSAPSAAGVSQDEQARQITDVLWKSAESGFSGPAFIFSIRDVDTADKDNEQDNFGALLTSDWQPKVAPPACWPDSRSRRAGQVARHDLGGRSYPR